MGHSITVTIQHHDTQGVVVLKDNTPLPLNQYEDIIGLLKIAYRQQYRRESLEQVSNLAKSGDWVFPKKRRDVFASGECVYFIQVDTMPGMVKIGQTFKLSARSKGLGNEYGGEVKILAFVRCPNHKEIEKAFHIYFANDRHADSEWFDSAPVLEYLGAVST